MSPDVSNASDEPEQGWARAAEELRVYRTAQRARLGELDKLTLAGFLAGSLPDDEREHVLQAMARSAELRRCVETVQDILCRQGVGIPTGPKMAKPELTPASVVPSPAGIDDWSDVLTSGAAEIMVAPSGPARLVMYSRMPQSVPVIRGFEFFAHCEPALEVGGDYYDFVRRPGNRLAIALGDVSGKGVAVARTMNKLFVYTQYCIRTKKSPSAVANELNRLLFAAGIEENFITLSLCVLDVEDRSLSITSAGHLPVLIRRMSGTVDEIGDEVTGVPLGIDPDAEYKQTTIKLSPGDVVAVFSDGVTNARNVRGELYQSSERRRLTEKLGRTLGGAETVGRAIVDDIRDFTAGQTQADDITLVCFGPRAEGG
jgi:hypothetical protein